MEREVIKVVRYFLQFSYPPSQEEIHTFLPVKISRKQIAATLSMLLKTRKLVGKGGRYTIGGYSIAFSKNAVRANYSQYKIQKISFYTKTLSLLPCIKLIGLSGSTSMMNAKQSDDIDLFIISAKGRMWTARFFAILIAELFGMRRRRTQKHTKDRICLNLFFDEVNLVVPVEKRTEYVAHEVLQMKPLVMRGTVYEQYLKKNAWVFDMFPNALDMVRYSKKKGFRRVSKTGIILGPLFHAVGNLFESLLEKFQLFYIKKHQTTELVTQTQLWFHPQDFAKKVKK
jgi:hypothetical protein